MDEGGELLRFRPRGLFEDPGDDPGPYGLVPPFRSYGLEPSYGRRYGDAPADEPVRLGELTTVVLVGDQVVDVAREPVAGSGYEGAVLQLRDRGLLPRPEPPSPPAVPAPHEQQLAWLARIVGGDDVLQSLSVEPLELLDLCLDGIRDDLHDRICGIDERLQRAAPLLLGEEGLAATRCLLTRAVAFEPGLVTRSDHDEIAAGAVVWAVAKGNDLVGAGRPLRPSVIQDVCGMRSTPSSRGGSFAHAVGGGATYLGRPLWMFRANPDVIPLGSPDLLLSRFRQRVALMRDLALQLRARTPAR